MPPGVRAAAKYVPGCVLVLMAATMAAAACGFDAAGLGNPSTTASADASTATTDGMSVVQIDPDASINPGCAWPTLQAGAPWPMLGGCVTHAGRSAFRGPRKTPREVWNADVTMDHPAPSIGADDTVYVPANGEGIRAFSPDGGSRLIDVGGGNVTNTPAVAFDGTLHAGAGRFVVAQRPDGSRTRTDLGDTIDTSAVLDADGNVYMGSYANRLVSLDAKGAIRWAPDLGGNVHSSAAIGPNGDVYVGSNDHHLWAFGKDGTKRWAYDAAAELKSSPVVSDDGTIYIGGTDSKLHAVTPDGQRKWVFDAGGSFDWQVLPALALDGTIYTPSGSRLVALRPDKTQLWSFDARATIRAAVVVDADGIIYVATDGEVLFAITPDGNELWSYDVGDTPYGFAIGRDGTMYVTCNNDRMYALHE